MMAETEKKPEESPLIKIDFSDDGQIVPLALRRTHRANAGAKRKQAAEESVKEKDKQKEVKKKRKKYSVSPSVPVNPAKSVVKFAADFIRSAKTKIPVPKAIKNLHPHNDFYCWVCHTQRHDKNFLYCNVCPRVYHDTCANLPCPQPDWVCFECENVESTKNKAKMEETVTFSWTTLNDILGKITDAECTETQSNAMASLNVDKLAKVLRTAIEKMKRYTNSLLFTPIDDLREFRDYRQFVYHPMDVSLMEKNVQDRCYGSTEAFIADAKWIVHNAYVYFGGGNKYSNAAKGFLKACETEMTEVELCPDCYLGAVYKRAEWFTEVCTKPHPLVWAKLHGFPFWPAKAMKEEDGLIEARFFGQHDRAMIPVHNCFHYSTKIPFPASKKRLTGLNAAIKEVELHIKKLQEKLGTPYKYAPHLTPYDPNKRYTTSSLAVMPDGKVKSLTDVGRNVQMQEKIMENGKDEPKKEESGNEERKEEEPKKIEEKEEGDAKKDSSVSSSTGTEEIDVEGDTSPEMKVDLSVTSSGDNKDEELKGDTSSEIKMDSSIDLSAGNEEVDGKGHFSQDKVDASVASSVDDDELDEETNTNHSPMLDEYSKHNLVGMEHSYALRDYEKQEAVKELGDTCEDFEDSTDHSQDKEEGIDQTDARDKDSCENKLEDSSIDRDRKRKLSESPTDQPDKVPRVSSVKDDNLLAGQEAESPDDKDTEKLQTSSSGDTSKEVNGTKSQGSLSSESKTFDFAGSKTLGSVDKDSFSILPTPLPSLDDLEASVNSSASSFSVPEDDVKSNQSTPRKDTFLLNLSKTIDTCKASLGIDEKEIEEEMADEGGRDDEDGLEDADTTGDETMESEDDEDEKSQTAQEVEVKEKKKDEEMINEKMGDGDLADKEEGVIVSITKPPEAGSESATKESSKLETQNESQSLGQSELNDTSAETNATKDGQSQNAFDDDDEVADDFDDDSSDGALLIDEGGEESEIPDKKEDVTAEKGTSAEEETTKTNLDGEAACADTDEKKEEVPKDVPHDLKEETILDKLTGTADSKKEENKEEAKGKESTETETKKPSQVEGKSVAGLSETAKDLLVGAPKAVEKDPDYTKLIAKVVDDAVKSFKELDESLADASVDLKKLVLDLKREVIALKAKQELQQKELQHCNKLAAEEIRQVMEYSRDSKLNRIKRRYDKEKGDAIFATKAKQWCASCSQEANYFCCWNTSYCSYECQERHWIKHEKKCQQKSGNFPFIPGPDFDPYNRKKKKKKKKKEGEQAWLREYGIFDQESDDDDPTWEPDPEDLPTMVPRKKTYSSPANMSRQQKPKVGNLLNSRTGSHHIPNRTWTQPSGSRNHPRPASMSVPSAKLLNEARQRFQSQLMNASSKNVPASAKQVYIPRQTVQQNGMPIVSQNVAGGSSVVINVPQKPVKFVQCPKTDLPKPPNVIYVGNSQAAGMQTGVQTGIPANLAMQTPTGGSGGIQNQGAPTMPIRLQMGPNNKIGVSSLMQALGQQPLQQGKYVIQLTPGQQGSNMQTVNVTQMGQPNQSGNMPVVIKKIMGGLPQGQVTPQGNLPGHVVQNIHPPVAPPQIMIPRLAPNTSKPVVISMASMSKTSTGTITVTPPVVLPNTNMTTNISPSVTIPVAAVNTPPGSTN